MNDVGELPESVISTIVGIYTQCAGDRKKKQGAIYLRVQIDLSFNTQISTFNIYPKIKRGGFFWSKPTQDISCSLVEAGSIDLA
jgi:hypothetical protein